MKQEINCNVKSCRYNNNDKKMCELQAILVSPVNGINTKQADESMCASYQHQQNQIQQQYQNQQNQQYQQNQFQQKQQYQQNQFKQNQNQQKWQ
ncbi:MAG: DUF1540 domain-containing protein [Clostridia bacterium]|nr:DUF1540 domain-containing protein [Clostridia bacterium]